MHRHVHTLYINIFISFTSLIFECRIQIMINNCHKFKRHIIIK